ncbi:MAG: CoA-binding protein [Polaromonas sp.]
MKSLARAERITYILNNCPTIAVVGLSPKPHRASFDVARYMQSAGYRIIPINPNATQVLGEKAYATLQEAAQHEKIDLVNCFRNSEDIPPIVDDAIAIGARAVWMQLGVAHAAAAASAEAAGLLVVQDHCLKIDHRVLLSSGVLRVPAQPGSLAR